MIHFLPFRIQSEYSEHQNRTKISPRRLAGVHHRQAVQAKTQNLGWSSRVAWRHNAHRQAVPLWNPGNK